MLLVVPGLFAGRGRTLLLTLATGFLLDGPIDRHVPQSMFKFGSNQSSHLTFFPSTSQYFDQNFDLVVNVIFTK